MKNQYRIKLEIKLKFVDKGINRENYILVIKVLKKDNRFNVKSGSKGDYESQIYNNEETGFTIGTNSYESKGSIGYFDFQLPNVKYIGRKITGTFLTDEKRKIYLKNLHSSLLEWGSYWGPFKNEPNAKFKVIKNKWYIYITK